MRRIEGLQWAQRLHSRPSCIPLSKPQNKAAQAGLVYERKLAAVLEGRLEHGVWWAFQDANGPGYCQTDFVAKCGPGFVVLESKYTWTPRGHEQLALLYRPVLACWAEIDPTKVLCVQVCKRLTKDIPADYVVSPSLFEAMAAAEAGHEAIWHHPGGVPLLGAQHASGATTRNHCHI